MSDPNLNNKQILLIIDTETGGIGCDYSLLTFHGMLINENYQLISELSLKTKPNDGIYKVCVEALQVNKIDLLEHSKNAIPYSEAGMQIKNWLWRHATGSTIVPCGQNVQGDISILKKHLIPDWDHYVSHRFIDTLPIAMFLKFNGKIPEKTRCSLSSLVKHYNIDISEDKLHDAKMDCYATLEVLKKMSLELRDNS